MLCTPVPYLRKLSLTVVLLTISGTVTETTRREMLSAHRLVKGYENYSE